jgi:integrase
MKQKRTRIAPNIYRYSDGRYEVLVMAAGRVAPPTRFPADTPLKQIRQWVDAARQRLTREARDLHRADFDRDQAPTRTGTLRTTAPDYFAQIAGRPSTAADTSHMRAWFEVRVDGVLLGDLPLAAWTTGHVNKAIGQWQTAPSPHAIRRVRITRYARKGQAIEHHERRAPATSGRIVSALTIRHRCRVLQDFFRTTDRKNAATPVDDAKVPARHQNPPPTVPVELVRDVLERLNTIDPQTFARFYVAATTGQRPVQVGRAQPDDLRFDGRRGVWLVRNAKGEPAHSIVLNPSQLAAWEAFIAADAWGVFDTTHYGNVIHRAGWPHGIRPYAVRHSIARAALQRGAGLGDVQALLGHRDPNTTRATYAPFQVEEQQSISDRLGSYLADVLKPRLVRSPGAKTRGKKEIGE